MSNKKKEEHLEGSISLVRGRRFIRIRPGEAVSLECPYCNGEMFEAKGDPSE